MANIDREDEVDQAVRRSLQRIPVPEHGRTFWERLHARLSIGAGLGAESRTGANRSSGPASTDRWTLHSAEPKQVPQGDPEQF